MYGKVLYGMNQSIIAYHKDEENDWVAELKCGHFQHVRNNPPFINRPWVVTVEGRRSMLGYQLKCKKCDRYTSEPDDVCMTCKDPIFALESLLDDYEYGRLSNKKQKRAYIRRFRDAIITLKNEREEAWKIAKLKSARRA